MQSSNLPQDKDMSSEKDKKDLARTARDPAEWTSAAGPGEAIRQFADSAAAALAPGAERLAQGVKGAAHQVAGLADDAARSIGDGSARVRQSSEEVTAACRGYVKDHPLLAVGIALGAGMLLSRLMQSR